MGYTGRDSQVGVSVVVMIDVLNGMMMNYSLWVVVDGVVAY